MSDAVRDQQYARVLAPEARPFDSERHEVTNVASDEEAPVPHCQFQERSVTEAFQSPFLVIGPNVVIGMPQPRTNSLAGNVRIKKQFHPGAGTTAG